MRVLVYRLCILFLLFVAPFIVSVQPASAHGVVGTGSPDTCTEAAFDTALAGGGVVTFNCGAGPLTVPISGTKVINAPTTIDGGGRITISGNSTFRLFQVKQGVAIFEFKNLILTGGNAGNEQGGVLTAFQTRLSLINSTFTANSAGFGGAIFCTVCRVTILDSLFTRNHSSRLGDNSQFSNTGGGAIHFLSAGQMTITNSQFVENTTAADGGAIANYGGNIKILNSTFTGNTAIGGGAIRNSRGVLSIAGSKFLGNKAKGGGAISSYRYSIEITDSTFANNNAESVGAISTSTCDLTIRNSTFNGNTATKTGGAIALVFNSLTISNSTIFGNKAESASAIVVVAANGTVTNTTIAGNISTKPGSGAIASNPLLTLKNTIIANNAGGNCSTDSKSKSITDGGGNLQFPDATCGSIPSQDPLLDPAGLKDNGGTTHTIALQPNSPAIRVGSSACMQFDQRGVKRPNPCSSGAFEPS